MLIFIIYYELVINYKKKGKDYLYALCILNQMILFEKKSFFYKLYCQCVEQFVSYLFLFKYYCMF